MNRVFPTGQCWCGCGEATPPTSFFSQGHDKRAEARVVKEVYGGVPEFLAAHGYGPEGRDPAVPLREGMDAPGLQVLEAWSKESNPHVALEVLNPKDRSRRRYSSFHVKYVVEERAFRFDGCATHGGPPDANLTVPLPDVAWVYVDENDKTIFGRAARVVRLRGAIVADPVPRFVSFA